MKGIDATIDKHICLNAWYGSSAKDLMTYLCSEIGPRPAGSPAIEKARGYIAERLRDLGAEAVREESVPVPLWRPKSASVELVTSENCSFRCIQNLFSASGEAVGPLVDIGDNREEKMRAAERSGSGAILLMDGMGVYGGKYVPFGKRVADIMHLRPTGIVSKSKKSKFDSPYINVVSVDSDLPVPCVSVSQADGEELAAAASESAKVCIRTDASRSEGECANLVADFEPASGGYVETIVLSAHLDSFWVAPGASDDLSGVVTVLEILRLLEPFRERFRRRLRVVLYTGEELFFLGSREYVRRHATELDQIKFVFNLDNVYTSTARGVAVNWSPEMRDHLDNVFKRLGREVEVRNMFGMSSDYLPFTLEGIPTGRQANYGDPPLTASHTALDQLDNMHIDWVQHNAMIFGEMIGELLLDPDPLPGRRLAPKEVGERLESDVRESLEFEGFSLP